MRSETADRRETLLRTLIALVVLVAGLGLGAGVVVADHGETTDEAPTSGGEVCDTVFGGPHLGYWCESRIGATIDDAVHGATP